MSKAKKKIDAFLKEKKEDISNLKFRTPVATNVFFFFFKCKIFFFNDLIMVAEFKMPVATFRIHNLMIIDYFYSMKDYRHAKYIYIWILCMSIVN